jgi:quercetin dioxygenase-like cupin family protein
VVQEYTPGEVLAGLIDSIHQDNIVSPFVKSACVKATLFRCDAGHELSEHTSSQTALIKIVRGEATVTLGDDRHELGLGSWLRMPPHLKHRVYAKTSMVMLLLMLGAEGKQKL